MRHPAIVPRALAASLALAACGGGSSGSTAPPTPTGPTTPSTPVAPAASAAIAMRTDTDVYGAASSSFAPSQVSIARNGSVTWSNATGVAHNVTFDAASGAPANVADFASGAQTRAFATPGTFGFQCTNHAGMAGTVAVAP